ncbi:hypothetical protein ACLOJK_007887 [Asimina triloba]
MHCKFTNQSTPPKHRNSVLHLPQQAVDKTHRRRAPIRRSNLAKRTTALISSRSDDLHRRRPPSTPSKQWQKVRQSSSLPPIIMAAAAPPISSNMQSTAVYSDLKFGFIFLHIADDSEETHLPSLSLAGSPSARISRGQQADLAEVLNGAAKSVDPPSMTGVFPHQPEPVPATALAIYNQFLINGIPKRHQSGGRSAKPNSKHRPPPLRSGNGSRIIARDGHSSSDSSSVPT